MSTILLHNMCIVHCALLSEHNIYGHRKEWQNKTISLFLLPIAKFISLAAAVVPEMYLCFAHISIQCWIFCISIIENGLHKYMFAVFAKI